VMKLPTTGLHRTFTHSLFTTLLLFAVFFIWPANSPENHSEATLASVFQVGFFFFTLFFLLLKRTQASTKKTARQTPEI
jgi:uncharacterized membrane protein